MKVELNTAKGVLEIQNPQNKHILTDNDLFNLLTIKWCLQTINFIKKVYIIFQLPCPLWSFGREWKHIQWRARKHCWMLPLVGQPFDRMNYHSEIPTQQKISPRNYIPSMKMFVTDENNEFINLNTLSLKVWTGNIL